MENLEQENRELSEEVTSLRIDMDNLTIMVEQLVATQNMTPPPPLPSPRITQPQQITVIYDIQDDHVSATPVVYAAQHHMPRGYPW